MRDFFSKEHWATMRKYWPWLAVAGAGFVMHAGTALLRLSVFFPSPKLIDFAGFYVSAWAIRQGLSPYNLPQEWLQSLQTAQAIPLTPAPIYHPPFWPWLLQPLTWFSYPVAAFIWLALNLILLIWATIALADMAGYRSRSSRLLLFFLAVTFGPVFLDLTLGQMNIVLLAAALAIGRSLSKYPVDKTGIPSRLDAGKQGLARTLVIAVAGAFAVGSKLFPLIWLGALAFLRRWRELILTALLIVAIFAVGLMVSLNGSREYAKYLKAEGLARWSEGSSVDDQALIAWLDRLVRPQTFTVSGFGVEQRTTVVWSPAWTVDAQVVRWVGYILLALLLLPCLLLSLRVVPEQHEAVFYLWVLYGLVALVHMERYNHVLLLPAMAWLWSCGRWQRMVVVGAYALVGLSRLTHLWAMLLPVPWGPLAAGFGMYAVFLLGGAIVISLWPSTHTA